MTLVQTVGKYIRAKIRLTKCQSLNFRQVCHKCKKYSNCYTYNAYVKVWISLQEKYKEQKERK